MPNIRNIALGITVDSTDVDKQLQEIENKVERRLRRLQVKINNPALVPGVPGTNMLSGYANGGENVWYGAGGTPYRGRGGIESGATQMASMQALKLAAARQSTQYSPPYGNLNQAVSGGAFLPNTLIGTTYANAMQAKVLAARQARMQPVYGNLNQAQGIVGQLPNALRPTYAQWMIGNSPVGIPNIQAPTRIGGWQQSPFIGGMAGAAAPSLLGTYGAMAKFAAPFGAAYLAAKTVHAGMEYGAARQQSAFMMRGQPGAQGFPSIVENLAASTGSSQTELYRASRSLAGYGFNPKEIGTQLQQIGNIAAATGSNFEDLAYAIGTMRTEGTMLSRDLRQLTSRGVDIIPELGKVLAGAHPELSRGRPQLSAAEVMGAISSGLVTYDISSQALANLNVGRYAGAHESVARTTKGLWSRAGNLISTGAGAAFEGMMDWNMLNTFGFGSSLNANNQLVRRSFSPRDIAAGTISLGEEMLAYFQGTDPNRRPSPFPDKADTMFSRGTKYGRDTLESMRAMGSDPTNLKFNLSNFDQAKKLNMLSPDAQYFALSQELAKADFGFNTPEALGGLRTSIMGRAASLSGNQISMLSEGLKSKATNNLKGMAPNAMIEMIGDYNRAGTSYNIPAATQMLIDSMATHRAQGANSRDMLNRLPLAGLDAFSNQQVVAGQLSVEAQRAAFRPSQLRGYVNAAEASVVQADAQTKQMMQFQSSNLMNEIMRTQMQNPNAFQGLMQGVQAIGPMAAPNVMQPGAFNANIVGAYQASMQRVGLNNPQLTSAAEYGSLEAVQTRIGESTDRFSVEENLQRIEEASKAQEEIQKRIADAIVAFAAKLGVRGN